MTAMKNQKTDMTEQLDQGKLRQCCHSFAPASDLASVKWSWKWNAAIF